MVEYVSLMHLVELAKRSSIRFKYETLQWRRCSKLAKLLFGINVKIVHKISLKTLDRTMKDALEEN